jgi:ATP-dependent RNA helicase DDX43
MNISVSRVFAESDDKKTPIPNPVLTFEHAFGPYPEIMKTIEDQKFSKPSPIQSQAWPVIMSGEDMIGIAQTGTGEDKQNIEYLTF